MGLTRVRETRCSALVKTLPISVIAALALSACTHEQNRATTHDVRVNTGYGPSVSVSGADHDDSTPVTVNIGGRKITVHDD